MMCDERTCRCASGDCLENRGLHLKISMRVEVFTHRVEHLGALDEYVLYTFIDYEVYVTLAITLLRVGECIIRLAILHLHYGERTKALGEHGDLLCVDRDLAHLGAEHVAFDSDEVAYVKKFLEDNVIHILVFTRTEVVAAYVHLYSSVGILKAP